MKKNILFIVGNEYHLYSSLCLYYKYYNTNDYNFKLIITKRPKSKRIGIDYDLPFDFFVLDDYLNYQDFRLVKNYPDYEKKLNSIFESVDELNTYFDFTLLITLIINWVKKNPNSKINLVQEGIGGYYDYVFRKKDFFRMLKSYVAFLYIKNFKGIRNIDFVYRWGFYCKIDALKMMHPDAVKKHIWASPIKLNLDVTSEINEKIKQIFKFNFIPEKEKRYILYLPISSFGFEEAKNIEYELINNLINVSFSRNFVFIIKVKSGVDSSIFHARYGSRVEIVDTNIPAEILISDLHNSIIISGISSALLHHVNNNKYFWVFPLLNLNFSLRPFTTDIKLLWSYTELLECIK